MLITPTCLKLSPLLTTGIWLINSFITIWSCPPRMMSISGQLLGSCSSWGTLIWVKAMIISHCSSSLRNLHILFEYFPTSSYSSSFSYYSISRVIQSSPAIPNTPILNPNLSAILYGIPLPKQMSLLCLYLIFPSSHGKLHDSDKLYVISGCNPNSWLP